MPILRIRTDTGGKKLRLIWRIREFLWLQRDPVTHTIEMAVFAGQCAIEIIARVNLQPGFGCQYFEHPSRLSILQPSRKFRLFGGTLVEGEIMVVATAEADLLVPAGADGISNPARLTEIERGAGDRLQPACGDEPRIDRGKGRAGISAYGGRRPLARPRRRG